MCSVILEQFGQTIQWLSVPSTSHTMLLQLQWTNLGCYFLFLVKYLQDNNLSNYPNIRKDIELDVIVNHLGKGLLSWICSSPFQKIMTFPRGFPNGVFPFGKVNNHLKQTHAIQHKSAITQLWWLRSSSSTTTWQTEAVTYHAWRLGMISPPIILLQYIVVASKKHRFGPGSSWIYSFLDDHIKVFYIRKNNWGKSSEKKETPTALLVRPCCSKVWSLERKYGIPRGL